MNHKILLVDDEKDIVDLIEEVLRQDGFQNIEKHIPGKTPWSSANPSNRM